MEWLLLAAAGAAVKWIVEKTLDALFERWRRHRVVPLTDAQVRRHHRWHFGIALVSFGYVVALLLITAALWLDGDHRLGGALVVVAIGVLATYLWAVVRRRWRRL